MLHNPFTALVFINMNFYPVWKPMHFLIYFFYLSISPRECKLPSKMVFETYRPIKLQNIMTKIEGSVVLKSSLYRFFQNRDDIKFHAVFQNQGALIDKIINRIEVLSFVRFLTWL